MHVVTTASLRTLTRLSPGSDVDVRRFRPNAVVETPDDVDGFPETDWLGKRLTIGTVELEVVAPCPRCVMVTRPVGDRDLGADRPLLRTIVREANQNVGVYATVVRTGEAGEGDAVVLS